MDFSRGQGQYKPSGGLNRPRFFWEIRHVNHTLSLDRLCLKCQHADMKQRYHTIIRPESNGWFVGWVEEIPGTLTQGRTLQECRRNLRDALQLMVETHRDEARLGMDENCILEAMEIEVSDTPQQFAQSYA